MNCCEQNPPLERRRELTAPRCSTWSRRSCWWKPTRSRKSRLLPLSQKAQDPTCYDAMTPWAHRFASWSQCHKDFPGMLSVPRTAALSGNLTPILVLIVLGFLLVPVQCPQGLHSIFVPANSPAVAAAVNPPHHQHAEHPGGHHAAAGGEARGSPISSASQRSTPSPVQSATIDQPYAVAMSRSTLGMEPLSVHLQPLLFTPLAPDTIGVAPDPPPPRSVA